MKKILALLLVAIMLFSVVSCGKTENPDAPASDEKVNVKAALICLHGDSSTYDKNFIDAFKQACANKGLTADDYTIVTDIPEGTACYDQAADLAEEHNCNEEQSKNLFHGFPP